MPVGAVEEPAARRVTGSGAPPREPSASLMPRRSFPSASAMHAPRDMGAPHVAKRASYPQIQDDGAVPLIAKRASAGNLLPGRRRMGSEDDLPSPLAATALPAQVPPRRPAVNGATMASSVDEQPSFLARPDVPQWFQAYHAKNTDLLNSLHSRITALESQLQQRKAAETKSREEAARQAAVIATVHLISIRRLKDAGRVRLCEILGPEVKNYYRGTKATWNHFVGSLNAMQEAFVGSQGFTRKALHATKYDAIQTRENEAIMGAVPGDGNAEQQAIAILHLPQRIQSTYGALFQAVWRQKFTDCLPPVSTVTAP